MVSPIPSASFLFLRRVCLSFSESICSIAIGLVLRASILTSLSRTLSSRRNISQGTLANLCRTTLVRVPGQSMLMLLSFFACRTSMFAPVTHSVEMIKFVTFATCHVTTNGSPLSRRYHHVSQTNAFHAASGGVTQGRKIVGPRQQWDVV